MTANERVKIIRKHLNLTQTKFAKQISISTSYLAGIETEVRAVNKRIIRLISDTFNVNEDWLKTGDGEMFNEDVDAAIAKVIGCFKSLSIPSQTCVLKQMEALFELQQSLEKSH